MAQVAIPVVASQTGVQPPSGLPLSVKLTVPVSATGPVGVTVAVNVTSWLTGAESAEEVSTVVVAALLTVVVVDVLLVV